MATIILTGGGTAGHCVPHLALLPYIKKDFDKIYYIGSSFGIEKNIIENSNIPYFSIECAKLERNFTLKNLTIPFKVLKGIITAGELLDKLKPNVIFSKGGYVSLPTVIAAKKRKIPVISHESDYTVGLANKITAKYCKKVLTSFPETAKQIKNGEYIGSPIRENLFKTSQENAKKFFGFTSNKPVLLVTGGSQGAQAINKCVREGLEELLTKFDVLHICGKGNVDKSLNFKGYKQIEYTNNIENAFSACSICVSRAGSNTIFELLSLKTPCLLIPLPKNASRGDQILNAKYFYKKGLVSVLFQDMMCKDSLVNEINATYANRFNLKKNLEKTPVKDASRQISRIIADYMR